MVSRGVYYPGFCLRPIANADSYYGVINDVLADAAGAVVIVHDDVWLGLAMETRVAGLIRELDRNLPNWGIFGNAGTRWDGARTRHVSDPHGGPQPHFGPQPVINIDGNVMLINCAVLRGAGLNHIPDFGGFHAYDLVLSLECLLHGLFVLVDSRLYVAHDSAGDLVAFNSYTKAEPLQEYLSSRFTDHVFFTINGDSLSTIKTITAIWICSIAPKSSKTTWSHFMIRFSSNKKIMRKYRWQFAYGRSLID